MCGVWIKVERSEVKKLEEARPRSHGCCPECAVIEKEKIRRIKDGDNIL